jgi:hypothetical protein
MSTTKPRRDWPDCYTMPAKDFFELAGSPLDDDDDLARKMVCMPL